MAATTKTHNHPGNQPSHLLAKGTVQGAAASDTSDQAMVEPVSTEDERAAYYVSMYDFRITRHIRGEYDRHLHPKVQANLFDNYWEAFACHLKMKNQKHGG